MDYKKAWDDLFSILRYEASCLESLKLREEQMIVSTALKGVIAKMKLIESKYQPKQYTWNEIIGMNPLPNKIKSFELTVYTLYPKNYPYFYEGYYLKINSEVYRTPSLPEMINLWTIIE